MAPDPPPQVATTTDQPEYDGVAADAVFNIPELLENILLDVPMKTLFTSQRVNKTWQATISGSTQIQQKMFLAPAQAKGAFRKYECVRDEDVQEDDEDGDWIFNFDFRHHMVEAVPLESIGPEDVYSLQASLNPLLNVSSYFNTMYPYDRSDRGEEVVVKRTSLLARITSEEEEISSQDRASYMDMFLCQPPAEAIEIICTRRVQTVSNSEGLRIGDIVAFCDRTSARLKEEGFQWRKSAIFRPIPENFDLKFAGAIYYQELGEPLLFCTPEDEWVEDSSTKKGVIYAKRN